MVDNIFIVNFVSCKLQEKEARDIEIPNIRWEVFELMMRLRRNYAFLFPTKSCVVSFYDLLDQLYTDSFTLDQ